MVVKKESDTLLEPRLKRFLREMSKRYKVDVFTLSVKSRADYFVDLIGNDCSLMKFKLYREIQLMIS